MNALIPVSAMTTGEALLSMYPVVVKSSPVAIDWQVFSRLLVYSIFPLFFASYAPLFQIPLTKWIFVGIINFVHIYTSYKGFQLLDVGYSMTLFYLYPVFNLILSNMILGESISLIKIASFFIPISLVYSIYNEGNVMKEISIFGSFLVLMSALTESLLYIMVKSTELGENVWNPLLFVYIFSFIGILVYKLTTKPELIIENVKNKDFLKLSIYNLLLGMFGYMLRFWAIQRIESVLYSVLSYTGIISAYIFGYLFFNEKITMSIFIKLLMFVGSLISIEIFNF